jgi:hypothetical protein
MAYRSFSTGTWQDPWFEKLGPQEKLLFIYLWTNDVCNQAGCYQISLRRVEFETGLKAEKMFQSLFPKIEWFPQFEIVWVKNFFRKQCANEKFALAAIRSLKDIPASIVEKYTSYNLSIIEKYGIDTVSIPYKTEFDTLCESVTVTGTDTVTDTVTRQKAVDVGFDEFWSAYPKKVGKQEAKKAWSKQNGNRPTLEIIITKLLELRKSEQWSSDGGKYIPHPAKWLNRGGWDDEIPKTTQSQFKIKYNDPNDPEEQAKYGFR